ncbi:MAG: diguanylate cyclase [Gammaproteobacteria bacterium]|nr:diguanylate cyclase [Gammaproteobacteria bacterium]
MRILIVVDTQLYQQLFQTVLSDLHIQADYVADGWSALRALQQGSYDMLCLGLHLPDMNGLDVCRQLRAEAATALLPIVLLTSDDKETTLKESLEAGITEVLRKSNFAELSRAFRQLLGGMRMQVKGRVLYVEDSQMASTVTLHLLEKMGLLIDHFISADVAWDQFQTQDYDLVITDILVEGTLSGVGLLRQIRGLEDERNRIPVLAISGLDDTARRIEILRQGANDYIAKPVVEEELRARVTNLITAKQLFDTVREQQRKLEEFAVTDQLTGLYNRHFLYEAAQQAVANASRHRYPLSLLLLDLDHFKLINDRHGHDVGDKVLCEVGALLRKSCRDGDVAARFGGEEFVLLLVQCPLADARIKAERLCAEVDAASPAGHKVTASIGVASLPLGQQANFEQLFKQADLAVYAAKRSGRNRVVLADPPMPVPQTSL